MCTLEESKKVIYNANLSSVLKILIKSYKWSVPEAKEAIDQYRNYLF